MLTRNYMLFYKDTDGFEVPLSEFGLMLVYPNEGRAETGKARVIAKITDMIDPIVEVQVRKWWMFWVKKDEKPARERLTEFRRKELVQQKNTLFVREVRIA